MSDPRSTYGEPVEEPTDVDDVVGRAHEGLADAEAARRDAADRDTLAREADARDAVHDDELRAAATESDASRPSAEHGASTATTAAAAAPSGRWDDSDDLDPMYAQHAETETEPRTHRLDARDDASPRDADAPTVAVAPVAGAAATGAAATAATAERAPEPVYTSPSAPQPIFVQAPEQPRPRGNRGAAGAIGLLAALVFAALYLAAWLGFGFVTGEVRAADLGTAALSPLTRPDFWVPVAVFFIGFWFLGAVINRGRWGLWVILGILVGIVSYVGHILGQLIQAPFWTLTASQGNQIVQDQLLAPLAIVAFVLGRELTIWFGAWVSSRGKRMTELNNEAQREYERTLEAGPQLVRA